MLIFGEVRTLNSLIWLGGNRRRRREKARGFEDSSFHGHAPIHSFWRENSVELEP
jgi:hypothetical protein